MATRYGNTDGLGHLYWQDINVADGTIYDPYNQIVSASSSSGLWSLTLDSAGGDYPGYYFSIPTLEPGWVIFVRFTEFTHPTVSTALGVSFGYGTSGFSYVSSGAGYEYQSNGTEIKGGCFVGDAEFGDATVQTLSGTTLVSSSCSWSDYGSGGGAGNGLLDNGTEHENTGLDTAGPGDLTALCLQLLYVSGSQVTLGFKLEYAIIAPSRIL